MNNKVSIDQIYTFSLRIRINTLRGKSLAIYFEDSQFKRIRTFNSIVSKLYVEKRSRVR